MKKKMLVRLSTLRIRWNNYYYGRIRWNNRTVLFHYKIFHNNSCTRKSLKKKCYSDLAFLKCYSDLLIIILHWILHCKIQTCLLEFFTKKKCYSDLAPLVSGGAKGLYCSTSATLMFCSCRAFLTQAW